MEILEILGDFGDFFFHLFFRILDQTAILLAADYIGGGGALNDDVNAALNVAVAILNVAAIKNISLLLTIALTIKPF